MSQSPAPLHLGSSYIMETRIGAGAQGEVWRGRRTDAREVLAFKVLRAELVENPDVVELEDMDPLTRAVRLEVRFTAISWWSKSDAAKIAIRSP